MTEERRRDAGDLRYAVDTLNGTVGDLKIAVGELKITVANMRERDNEDRTRAELVEQNVTSLMIWRGRITGQLAILWLVLGALVALVAGHALRLTP